MPIYEFKCKNCEALFESIISQSESFKEMKCPLCGFEGVEKVMSGFSVGSSSKSSSAGTPPCAATCSSPRGGKFG